jgi:cytochrome c-type biogenesis protein CcmE
MTPKKLRLFGIISFILPLGFGVFFLLSALNSNIVYFIDPTELISKKKTGQRLRLGGLVKSNSIEIIGTKIQFQITDGNNSVTVNYDGSLPDLFKENQGVIVQGIYDANIFKADTLLAKHDENYMPREISKSLKSRGVWRGKEND